MEILFSANSFVMDANLGFSEANFTEGKFRDGPN